jgi:DeoR/GlpR family transcriptional regulator of sugar metabolism
MDIESKTGIARAAADMIRDGQVVLIDGGTTNLRIASYLSRERSATIVTNSPPLALALADHPKLSVLVLGGNFLKEARVTAGIDTIRVIESIRADLCFLGMCSLHPEVGITVGDLEEAYVKKAMIGASTEVVGLISFWKNGDISALPGRSCFPTDPCDHRRFRRRCVESLPFPRHKSHKHVNRLRFERTIGFVLLRILV